MDIEQAILARPAVTQQRFQLEPDYWYACQFIQQRSGERCTQDFRPIYIRAVMRRSPYLRVEFMDVVFPCGQHEESYDLTVMVRTGSFLFANVATSETEGEPGCVLISPISREWMEQCASQFIEANPPEQYGASLTGSVEEYLDRVFRPRGHLRHTYHGFYPQRPPSG